MVDGIELYCGDCLEVMRQIPNGSVDMVLTDPPYSSGGQFAGDRKASTSTKYTDTGYNGAARFQDFSGDNMDQRSFMEFTRMVFALARRKSAPEAVLATFVDWRNLPAITDSVQAAGWIWRGVVVWDKGNARNTPGRFRPDCEFIVWATNGPKRVEWTHGQPALPGCYHIPSIPTLKKRHQTEKPVKLLESILNISPPGATVLDPFMGSGSVGVACTNMGRSFIGVELGEEYYETAKARINEAAMLHTLAYTE